MATGKPDSNETRVQISVGRKVRELRTAAGMSATTLAARAGISQGHLSKIENGKTTLSIKVLLQICRVFNRQLNYLFRQADEEPQILGTLNIADGPEKVGFQWFAQAVRRLTANRISLVPMEAYQLGMASSQAKFLQQGVIDLFIEDLDHLQQYAPEANIFSLPYAFDDVDHELRFLESDFFHRTIHQPLLEQGIRLINPQWNWLRGAERALVSKTPIFSPRDVEGLKVRIFDSEILQRFWQDLGAIPILVPWAEANDALQGGHIDILPTHLALVYSLGFCETAPYVTRIGRMPSILGVAMNETKYQLLSPADQGAIAQACQEAGDKFSAAVKEMEAQNEQLTIERYGAVHINAGTAPWKQHRDTTVAHLLHEEILSDAVWREVQNTRL